jgi:hypothetical protein
MFESFRARHFGTKLGTPRPACARSGDERAKQCAFSTHDADPTTDQIARKARSKFQNQCSCSFERVVNVPSMAGR